MIKKSLLTAIVLFMTGCSKEKIDPIEEPTVPEADISLNISVIEQREKTVKKEKESMESTDLKSVIDFHKKQMERAEQDIENLKKDNELLKKTLIYNDNFRVVDGTGIYVKKHEGMLSANNLSDNFSEEMLGELARYKDTITNGVGLIVAAPFQSEGEKHPVITVYLTQDDLNSIDFDKSLDSDDRYTRLYDSATYVKVHSDFSTVINKKGEVDDLPDLILGYSTQTY